MKRFIMAALVIAAVSCEADAAFGRVRLFKGRSKAVTKQVTRSNGTCRMVNGVRVCNSR